MWHHTSRPVSFPNLRHNNIIIFSPELNNLTQLNVLFCHLSVSSYRFCGGTALSVWTQPYPHTCCLFTCMRTCTCVRHCATAWARCEHLLYILEHVSVQMRAGNMNTLLLWWFLIPTPSHKQSSLSLTHSAITCITHTAQNPRARSPSTRYDPYFIYCL